MVPLCQALSGKPERGVGCPHLNPKPSCPDPPWLPASLPLRTKEETKERARGGSQARKLWNKLRCFCLKPCSAGERSLSPGMGRGGGSAHPCTPGQSARCPGEVQPVSGRVLLGGRGWLRGGLVHVDGQVRVCTPARAHTHSHPTDVSTQAARSQAGIALQRVPR